MANAQAYANLAWAIALTLMVVLGLWFVSGSERR